MKFVRNVPKELKNTRDLTSQEKMSNLSLSLTVISTVVVFLFII